ncbi:hypothetical protein ACOME3_007751 [Neoechinorhynchus agilis]
MISDKGVIRRWGSLIKELPKDCCSDRETGGDKPAGVFAHILGSVDATCGNGGSLGANLQYRLENPQYLRFTARISSSVALLHNIHPYFIRLRLLSLLNRESMLCLRQSCPKNR